MPAFDAYAATLAQSHVAPVYVSPLFGSVVYTAEVSATPTFPAKAIAITGGSGTVGNIVRGARIVFTDALGVWKGQSHIRFSGTISSATLPIRETASGTIDIAAGDLVAVYSLPLLVEKLVEADEAFNPDGVAVSDTNQYPYPLACSGGWYVNFLPDSGSLVIPTYGADSTTVDIDSAGTETHGWATSGGTLSSTSAVSPTLTVSAAGEYRLVHTVTDDTNGKVSTQYVPLRVHDANDPPLEGVLNSVDGDPRAGFRASVTLFENATLADLPDGTPVIVWVDERLGGEALSYGHKVDGRSNILIVGYLRRDEWELGDDGAEGVTFEVISPLARLQEIAGYSKVMENNATPDAWSEIKDLSMSRAMIQLLMHYTNALELFDLLFIGFIDKDYPALFLQRSTPYDQVKELADGVVSRIICDRAGRLEIQRRLEATPLDERATPATTITLTKEGVAEFRMSREHVTTLDTLKTNGFTKGYTGNVAFYCKFPASPNGGTQIPQITRLVVEDYADALETTALLGAWEDRVFFDADGNAQHAPELTITLYGGYSRLFQFYREWVAFSGVTTLRGVDLSDFRWILMSVSETIEDGAATTTLTLRAETHAPASAAGDDTPPEDGTTTTDPPPVTYPPVVVTNPPVTGDGLTSTSDTLAVFDSTNGKAHIVTGFRRVLTGGTPDFADHALSLTGTLAGFCFKAGTSVNGYLATTSRFYPITDVFGARTLGTPYVYAGGAAADARQVQIQSERGSPSALIIAVYNDSDGTNAYYSIDGGGTWAAGTGLPTAYDSNLPANAATWMPGLWVAPDGSGQALVSAATAITNPPGADFWQTSNFGATWTKVTTTGWDAGDWTCGAIAKPLNGAATYHGYVAYSGGITQGIRRIIGTTQTTITPSDGGADYGTGYGNNVGQRAISVADNDANAVVVVGYNAGVNKFGVFQSFDRGVTWNVIVTPDTGVPYRGAYYVNRSTIYLYGTGGALAIALYAAGAWSVYATTVSGCGTIVGLCGG